MKTSPNFISRTIFLILLFAVFSSGLSFAQPPGMPPCAPSAAPGETACTAAPICDLNGYCGRTLSSYTADAWATLRSAIITCSSNGFDQLDINNDSYLKFIAGSTSITFDVYVYDCIKPVTTKAIQLAVFSAANCGSGPVDVKYCNKQMNQQNTPHNVTINNLTPGETYYILIDGYSSQNCAYSFVATSGVSMGLTVNLSKTTICPGETVTATVTGGSGSYTWSGSTGLNATTGASVTVTPPATPGVYNYHVESSGSTGGTVFCPTSSGVDFSITVSNGSAPTFNQLGAFCTGQSFTLPATSLEGIAGTWSPAVNNTATTTYTFTPASSAGSCASTATMTVVINNQITPGFNTVGPFCTGQSFTLPATSLNGISGTWSPAINNTQTTTYTFTPAAGAGSCASTTTMTVTINNQITPGFNTVGPFCPGQSFTLPVTSLEGISGTWSPAVNNTQTTTYTFTPASGSGSCAGTTTMTVAINNQITPSFNNVGPVCSGVTFTLPTTSLEGISGTWSPAVNNTQTTIYTFTPASGSGSCMVNAVTMEVIVNPLPVATAEGEEICSGSTLGVILTSSIPGTVFSWTAVPTNVTGASNGNGSEIDQVLTSPNGGNVVYTITPVAGTCSGNPVNVTVTVLAGPVAAFSPSVTSGEAPLEVVFQNTSVNATAYTWSFGNGQSGSNPATTVSATYNEAGTYEVVLIASNGTCTDTAKASIVVVPSGILIHVPNVFTPNGDHVNDVFYIGTTNAQTVYTEIFNRWGNLMAKLEKPTDVWDGGDSPVGVYFYKYSITDLAGKMYEGQGFFHLEKEGKH